MGLLELLLWLLFTGSPVGDDKSEPSVSVSEMGVEVMVDGEEPPPPPRRP